MLKIAIIAGEPSGDMYGARLVEALKERTSASFFGMGGEQMKAQGVELIWGMPLSIVGGVEAVFAIPKALSLLKEVVRKLQETKPDLLILIDFAEFNLSLLKASHSLGIKTSWLSPPTAWAWRPERAKVVARLCDLAISFLPFEADFYRESGAKVIFVGHPLLDMVKPEGRLTFSNSPIIGLLPGSRVSEVKRLLPIMANAVRRLSVRYKDLISLLILSPAIQRRLVEEQIKGIPCKIISDRRYEAMASADILLVTSGTATLEAAILKIPSVILYKMDTISYLLAKSLVRTKFIGLPNIIAGKEVFPELLQREARPENIVACVEKLLKDKSDMEKELEAIKEKLGLEGAMNRASEALLGL
ncbi:MAG: lipid-A-disaccharide synthase [Candidatus Desantisbacteria bacterium]